MWKSISIKTSHSKGHSRMRSCSSPNAKYFSWQLGSILTIKFSSCLFYSVSVHERRYSVLLTIFFGLMKMLFSVENTNYTILLLWFYLHLALESWLLYSGFGFFAFFGFNFFGFLILDEISFSSIQRPCFAIAKTY